MIGIYNGLSVHGTNVVNVTNLLPLTLTVPGTYAATSAARA